MSVIWKYSVPFGDEITIPLPGASEPLAVQMQDGVPMLWVKVATGIEPRPHIFRWVATGQTVTGGSYVGTLQDEGLVFHLFFTVWWG